jgi:hypothetical protein
MHNVTVVARSLCYLSPLDLQFVDDNFDDNFNDNFDAV